MTQGTGRHALTAAEELQGELRVRVHNVMTAISEERRLSIEQRAEIFAYLAAVAQTRLEAVLAGEDDEPEVNRVNPPEVPEPDEEDLSFLT